MMSFLTSFRIRLDWITHIGYMCKAPLFGLHPISLVKRLRLYCAMPFLPSSYLFNWSIFSLLIDMLTAFDSHSMFANNWPSIESRCISRQNVDICPSWPSFSTLVVVGAVLLTVSFYCPSLSLWDQMLAQHQALNWTNTHTGGSWLLVSFFFNQQLYFCNTVWFKLRFNQNILT